MNAKELNKQIMDKFLNDLLDVIENDCKQYFIDLMTKSIKEVVYDAYEPTQYKRRMEKEGLIDPNNYMIQAFFDKSGKVCVFMKNMTHGDRRAYYIDEGIVTGRNFYDWKRSKAYQLAQNGGFQRDFYTYMEFTIVNDSRIKNLIRNGMEKRGWKSK